MPGDVLTFQDLLDAEKLLEGTPAPDPARFAPIGAEMFKPLPLGAVKFYDMPPPKEWFRKPRSKKRRIRKKWRNRTENWRALPTPIYMVGNDVFCSPRDRIRILHGLGER